MSFGKQAQQLITDPEVYRLFEAVAGKVDAIVELLAEKRRSAVAILKDYTDGLMETMEGQLKPLPPAEEEEEEEEEVMQCYTFLPFLLTILFCDRLI